MLRRSTFFVLVALLLVTMVGSVASASDHRRTKPSGHRYVGTWLVDADTSTTQDAPVLLSVSADGNVRLSDCCSSPAAGVWASTGRRTAEVTILLPWGDEEGFIGFNTARGAVEISADGQSFTATYTFDPPTREGGTSGQLGPLTGTGVRVDVEPMGEPIAPLPTEVAASQEPEGSPVPEVSPAGSPPAAEASPGS